LTVIIRGIQKEDYDRIIAVVQELADCFDEDARLRAIPIDLCNQIGFIATLKEEIVGFITLFMAEGRINIGWLGVLPKRQRQGIGHKLLKQAEKIGRELGAKEIATSTLGDSVDYKPYVQTRNFYFKNGFQVYQRNKTDNPSCPEEIKIKKAIL
jgi:GNAT superfamily N-acetyltransferase